MKRFLSVIVLASVGVAQGATREPATSQPVRGRAAFKHVEAVIAAHRTHVHVGEPVWIDFLLYNTSDRPIVLDVPETKPASTKDPVMGLPVEHVFSGERFRALSVLDGAGKTWGREVMQRPANGVAAVSLAPKGVVGVRLEMGHYYTALRRSGLYVLQWLPYGGAVKSNALRIELKPLREVVITTNQGKLRLQLLYDKAPNHVANFLELIEDGFYNRTKFFRLWRGWAVMGGDPHDDGSGMRKDGKTVKAEFNDAPFEEGTVGMSLAGNDPNSGSCQFFISLRRVKEWDWKYTAFAKVVGLESLETLRKIGQMETDEHDRPVRDIIVERMNVETIRKTISSQETHMQVGP